MRSAFDASCRSRCSVKRAQHVVEGQEAVGDDHALDRRVQMSRSCQRATFSSAARAFARTRRARPVDLLAAHRVALVGHGRGALLPRAERLLDLAHLGLLQGADLGRELLEARRR